MGFFMYHWHRISFNSKKVEMKNIYTLLAFIFLGSINVNAQDAKTISDCTVTYDLTIQDAKADPTLIKMMTGATKVLYIKGTKTRSDLVANGFKQTTLFDSKNDSTVVLRESGNSKFISYLDGTKRKQINKKFDGVKFTNTSDKKTILGYECKKVIATLADGSTYNVFYTPGITTINSTYEYQFKDIGGLVLEYEALTEDGKTRVNYSASKISLIPVPVSIFEVPKSGYRVL